MLPFFIPFPDSFFYRLDRSRIRVQRCRRRRRGGVRAQVARCRRKSGRCASPRRRCLHVDSLTSNVFQITKNKRYLTRNDLYHQISSLFCKKRTYTPLNRASGAVLEIPVFHPPSDSLADVFVFLSWLVLKTINTLYRWHVVRVIKS